MMASQRNLIPRLHSLVLCALALMVNSSLQADPSLSVQSGLQIWLAADKIEPSDSSQVVQRNGYSYVKEWRDQTAAAQVASQAINDRQPALVTNAFAGKPGIRFDGANDT